MSTLVYLTKMCQKVNIWSAQEGLPEKFPLITNRFVIVQSILVIFLMGVKPFYHYSRFFIPLPTRNTCQHRT